MINNSNWYRRVRLRRNFALIPRPPEADCGELHFWAPLRFFTPRKQITPCIESNPLKYSAYSFRNTGTADFYLDENRLAD